MNMIHSEASPEELSDEVSDSEVCGTPSSSAATSAADPSELTWVLDRKVHWDQLCYTCETAEGLIVRKVASDSSSNLCS